MLDHVKPTPEELEAATQQAIIDAEATPPEETPDKPEEKVDEPEVPADQEDAATNEGEDDTPDTEETPDKPEEKPQAPDYKEKFTESTREAQILFEKNRKINEAIEGVGELPAPTDEELQREARIRGFDIEDMSVVEKDLFKTNVWNEKKLDQISKVSQVGKDIEKWNGEVDTFVTDPKTLLATPALEGKVEEFKIFATKPSRRGVDFDVLVGAFLHTVDAGKVTHKGKMMATGSGGAKEKSKPVSSKLTLAQGEQLRNTNYKEYRRQLQAGNIEEDAV